MAWYNRFFKKNKTGLSVKKQGLLHFEPVKRDFIPMPTKQPNQASGKRGYNIIDPTNGMRISATDKAGKKHNVNIENKYTRLSFLQKLEMYEKCPPILGVVTSRANRISTLDYSIVPIVSIEDQIVSELKMYKQLFEENQRPGAYYTGKRIKAFQLIRQHLHDVFPDLSNFDASLRRWKHMLKKATKSRTSEIEEFFAHPSPGVLWTEFIKSFVQDLLVQGAVSIYKTRGGNLHILPGGSVFPIQSDFVGGASGYVQIPVYGGEPQIFFRDEIAYAQYMPNSNLASGINPMESLVNLVAENLLFSERMAVEADGSEAPRKLLVFGEPDSMGGGEQEQYEIPLDEDDQQRVEEVINQKKKEVAVKVISGYGTPTVLDLSKADTVSTQLMRQDKIDKYVAMSFNASNAEINQTGGDGTSGKSTSETQERADNAKGVRPTVRIVEELFTHEIIPFTYGYGWRMVFSAPRSDEELVDLAMKKVNSGIFDTNEVRVEDFNKEPYPEEQYDRPQQQKQEQPATISDIQGMFNQ